MKYFLLLLTLTVVNCDPFKTIISWKQVYYNLTNDELKECCDANGHYDPANISPLGVNIWNDKLFITVPRWKKGVPANLNYINLHEIANNSQPLLNPYPDFASNNIKLPDTIVNILRVRVDACDRLWGVDSGVDDILGEFTSVQPKKLIAIDLKTNKIVVSYQFKESDLTPNSFFADTAIDVDPNKCEDAYVYNSDLGGYGLVVYSLAKNESWRISHHYFHFDPLQGDFNVSGLDFHWTDGVFGLALSEPKEDGSKTLYFHPMVSANEFSVSTIILKNKTAMEDPRNWYQFHVEGFKGPKTQGTSSLLDPDTGIIYFTQIHRNALSCWDTHEPLKPENFRVIYQNNETLTFPNDIARDSKTGNFYCLSNNLPVLQYSKYNPEENNFNIHMASLKDMATLCKAKKN